MTNPITHRNDPDGIIEREMTDDELAALIASGWTLEGPPEEPTPEEETPEE
jgi:hypothetical protein